MYNYIYIYVLYIIIIIYARCLHRVHILATTVQVPFLCLSERAKQRNLSVFIVVNHPRMTETVPNFILSWLRTRLFK